MAFILPRALKVLAGEPCDVCGDSVLSILELAGDSDRGGLMLRLRWVRMCRCGLSVEGACVTHGDRFRIGQEPHANLSAEVKAERRE